MTLNLRRCIVLQLLLQTRLLAGLAARSILLGRDTTAGDGSEGPAATRLEATERSSAHGSATARTRMRGHGAASSLSACKPPAVLLTIDQAHTKGLKELTGYSDRNAEAQAPALIRSLVIPCCCTCALVSDCCGTARECTACGKWEDDPETSRRNTNQWQFFDRYR